MKLTSVVLVVLLCVTSAVAGSDAFNRAKIGKTWVATSGVLAISNGQMVGTGNLPLGYLKASKNDSGATAVVFLTGNSQYGAVALGNIALGNNAFVKIQQQSGSGKFEYGGFYTGDNNPTGTFFALSTPVPSPAVLDVFFCGTTATMRIISAAGIQTYTYNYGVTFPKGAGVGFWGQSAIDNYVGFPSGCYDLPEAIPATLMPSAMDLSLGK